VTAISSSLGEVKADAEALAKARASRAAKADNLEKIEGIGPKIAKLLNADGIMTFAQLAEAPLEQLKAILSNAGPRFAIHDPSTWSEQASLAAKGEWDKFKALTDALQGGRRV
jgi:predicted flap endonuclease-1-like 5' DNA nuclease